MDRWQSELEEIPIGHMLTIRKELRDAKGIRARQLIDAYEERIAMIAEGRDPTPEDISAAWSSTLRIPDLMLRLKKRGDEDL